jgi:YggT family protein
MRAMLGPLKKVPAWWRCVFPALGLVLLLSLSLWVLPWAQLHPPSDIVSSVLHSVPLALAMIVDLARVWIVLLIARCVLSFIPVWRPPVVEVMERVTEPLLRPLQRFPLKAGQFDFTPVVAILALAVAHWLVMWALEQIYLRL